MTWFGRLALQQTRSLCAVLLGVWGLFHVLVLMTAAGLLGSAPWALGVEGQLILALWVLPSVLQVVLPAWALHRTWRLAEGGELRAAMTMGRPALLAVAATLLPALLLACGLPSLVHELRPRARAALAGGHGQEARLVDLVDKFGGAVVEDADGLRALIPYRDGGLALRAAAVVAEEGPVLRFRSLRLEWPGPAEAVSFERLWLRGVRPDLRAQQVEQAVASSALERDAALFRRARPGLGAEDRADLRLARELALRTLILPGVLLGLLPCLVLAWCWRRLDGRAVYALFLPLGLGCSLWLPRLFS